MADSYLRICPVCGKHVGRVWSKDLQAFALAAHGLIVNYKKVPCAGIHTTWARAKQAPNTYHHAMANWSKVPREEHIKNNRNAAQRRVRRAGRS